MIHVTVVSGLDQYCRGWYVTELTRLRLFKTNIHPRAKQVFKPLTDLALVSKSIIRKHICIFI